MATAVHLHQNRLRQATPPTKTDLQIGTFVCALGTYERASARSLPKIQHQTLEKSQKDIDIMCATQIQQDDATLPCEMLGNNALPT
jgi:hypothetical protein